MKSNWCVCDAHHARVIDVSGSYCPIQAVHGKIVLKFQKCNRTKMSRIFKAIFVFGQSLSLSSLVRSRLCNALFSPGRQLCLDTLSLLRQFLGDATCCIVCTRVSVSSCASWGACKCISNGIISVTTLRHSFLHFGRSLTISLVDRQLRKIFFSISCSSIVVTYEACASTHLQVS